MNKSVLFLLACAFVPAVYADQQSAGIMDGDIAAIMATPAAIETRVNAETGYPIPYRIAGLLSGDTFATKAGTFTLDKTILPPDTLRQLAAGGSMMIEGWAKRSDAMPLDNNVSFRPLKVVSAQQQDTWRVESQAYNAALVSSSGKYVVSNVRWLSKWDTAEINPSLINKVYVVKKPIPEWHPLLVHTFLLFTFKEGGLIGTDKKPMRGLVFSMEARARRDVAISQTSVLDKTFNVIWVVATEEDYIERTCGLNTSTDNRLYPAELKISAEQRVQLLDRAVKIAAADREGEYYNVGTNNCTTGIIRVINGVLPEGQRIVMFDKPWSQETPSQMEASLDALVNPEFPEINPSNYKDKSVWPQ